MHGKYLRKQAGQLQAGDIALFGSYWGLVDRVETRPSEYLPERSVAVVTGRRKRHLDHGVWSPDYDQPFVNQTYYTDNVLRVRPSEDTPAEEPHP